MTQCGDAAFTDRVGFCRSQAPIARKMLRDFWSTRSMPWICPLHNVERNGSCAMYQSELAQV